MFGYTYFESYYNAIRKLPDAMRLALRDAIDDYMFIDKEPELDDVAMCMFELVRPHLDVSKKRGKAGKTESKKIKQNQTESNEIKQNQTEIKSETSPSKKRKEDEKEKENENEKELKDVCVERSDDHATLPVIKMPLVDGTEYGVTQADVDEYQNLYPGVNVMQELRSMRGWCLGNPKQRKTPAGIRRFIVGWLSKEQNRSRGQPQKKNPFSDGIRQEYDYNDLRAQFVVNA